MVKVSKWNLADEIETKEDVLGILEAALEENDLEFLFTVIGDIAKSKGMTQVADELGLSREQLYRSFSSSGNPLFSTVVRMLDTLGYKLSVRRKRAAKSANRRAT